MTKPSPAAQASGNPGQRNWIKASRSYGNGECIELAQDGETILMRDSKDPEGPHLRFSRRELAAFLRAAGDGEFDHLAG